MYGMVLMAAMTGSADMTEIGHHNRGGCSGSMVYSGGCTGSGCRRRLHRFWHCDG